MYFFRRGSDRVSCETRLHPEGRGFQLVVTQNGEIHVEEFAALPDLVSRADEFLTAWKAHGWRSLDVAGAEPSHTS